MEGGELFNMREENARPHPFMGYWFPISPIMAGAHPFFFTPIHLLNAERMLEFGGQGGWILYAQRDLTRFFFSFSPVFPFLFFTPILLFRSPHRGENMALVPHSHRKPSTTAKGLILWRVWGKADISGGYANRAARQGWAATCKEYPRFLSVSSQPIVQQPLQV